MDKNEKRLEDINQLILEIAGGKLGRKLEISSAFDEIDAIASGINMLGEELQASMIDRNYFNCVLKSIVDILIIFDQNYQIIQINDKALESLGYPEQDLLGKSIGSLVPDEEKEKFFNLIAAVQEQEALYNAEVNFCTALDEKLPLAISVSKLQTKSQMQSGYVLLAKDLKQFYILSDALKKKNKELETFVYKVSHDLKGPVASLLGLLELSEREDNDLATIRAYMGMMKSSLQRLDKSIVSFLNFTLATRTDIEPQKVMLKQEVYEVIKVLWAFPNRSYVSINNLIPDELSLYTIPELLRSVLQNFIENAIKYRSRFRPSSVDISAETHPQKTIIRIRDNGIGMSPYIRERAFDMYFRGHSEAPGSGLGLYITKASVEKLGGEIYLCSEEGKGTEVKITLPNLNRYV
ncbi:MAG: ATP-binding protein [Cyclobacteriaceae bacterium]